MLSLSWVRCINAQYLAEIEIIWSQSQFTKHNPDFGTTRAIILAIHAGKDLQLFNSTFDP